MSDNNQILFQLNVNGNANRVINDLSQTANLMVRYIVLLGHQDRV